MATKIRLARGGKKKRPFYRIVAADSRAPRDGKYIERLGSFDPLLAENKVTLIPERIMYWLDQGAQPSERVSKLLTQQGIEHKMIILPNQKMIDAKKVEHQAAKDATAAAKKDAEDKAAAEAKEAAAKKAEEDKAAAEPAAEAEA